MSLQLYLSNGWIREHETSPAEIAELLAIADRDIGQSQLDGLGPEWRFGIAYNAALQLATAALAAAGYKAERQNKHMRTIACMAFTFGTGNDVDFFDRCRRKRHTHLYDRVGAISAQEATEMVAFAVRIRTVVERWLRDHHCKLS